VTIGENLPSPSRRGDILNKNLLIAADRLFGARLFTSAR
jgi:hypothetical protein